jgi:PAS domain S-box-containing protein
MAELDYRRVVDGFTDAVIVADDAGRISYANRAVEQLLGWSQQDLLGQPLTVIMPARYHDAHHEGFRRFVTTRRARIIGKPVQLVALHRDGTELDVELTLSAHEVDGRPRIAAAIRDLRDRVELDRQRTANRLIRERERRAALIADALPQIVWIAGGDGVVQSYNRRFYEYSGRDPAAPAASETWEGLMHPDDRAAGLAAWRHSLETGALHDVEIRLRRASDGAYRWHLLRSVPVGDSVPVTTWVGTATDIDDQKRGAERATFMADASALLAHSLDPDETLRQLARLAVPRIADWCSIHVAEGTASRQLIVAHSDPAKVAWAEELNREYPPDPAAPRGVRHVIRTGQAEIYPDVPEEMLVAAARDERHLQLIRELGIRSAMTVPLIARGATLGAITLVTAESGRRYEDADVHLARELADRAALAVDNARLYAEAQEAVRARDDFLSIASHELRTPLTPLQLHVQDLLRRAGGEGPALSGDKLAGKLDTVARQVDRMQSLVENLLDISRITQHRLVVDHEEIDLAETVREVVARFARAAEHAGVALVVDAPEPVRGSWDRHRLDQIVSNLVANALKFGAGKPVELRARSQDGIATLVVRDQGIGIAPEHQARIFERFERAVTSKHYGGFGLGLWIVRQIVEALGGTIDVESRIGAGSRFTVALPVSAQARPASAASPAR